MADAREIAERLRYMAIEGCIGVGKTTLTKLLGSAFHTRIYLHAPMDIVLERIRRRGRPFEVDMDQGYLEDLVAAYNRFFASYPETPGGAPTLIVDTEHLNFPDRDGDLEVVLDALSTFPREGEYRRVIRSRTDEPRLL